MRGFGIWKIDDGIYDILDEGNSSFYIVEGEDRAAVIDTGISPGQKILPLIRKYTSKPLILVLTHAHIDHWYHMDEFETVYMCHREFEVGADALRDMMADKELHPERTLDIRTDTRIELGGTALSICECQGIRRAASWCSTNAPTACLQAMPSAAAMAFGCKRRQPFRWKPIMKALYTC